ncbi:50S ribosomal protein L2 [candidate division WS6 bacterium RIFOXYD1_FULL_33_8]|uniref:50S ribosomal protein L2 n=2 Tax=Candidatus Dojkabacteria TaxID=74243 RepID=A0A0G0CU89_9BACT|nr:ribosomal protein L2 [uncultured bacterium]KKP42851.1 MAG: 50S ribosomal protein L2, large subunit ribosomal protein L2 [candidate division WS6 bacterium GW2011_GWE2_33_157]KKP44563.1 MAG: 50S ribosomal protein L2, large subunit ribosomal protein L2 [candidate division WS6 bacterium GW2011_GWC1_33_20]KKP46127.1 MAG: 50S ribosomal protein L2, large subunit ribosomal protein L2 [candidate division WS6 bacterium GW2011_GWF1_33_233]KKP54660.1 MAG: 50S ribosomal protein L2 [candidate division WS6
MAVRTFKATTSTLRGTRLEDRSMLEKDGGPKNLTIAKRQKSGRNSQGRITVRHRGGGAKRRIRIVDFKRDKFGVKAKVLGLYYDPNRSAHLALLQYADGDRRYIIAPKGIGVGDSVVSGEKVDVLVGNAMMVKNIPSGTIVHCIENRVGKGATFGRSAGQEIVVQGIDPTGKYVQIKLSSGEIRLVPAEAMATIGQVGNEERLNVKLGKAGRKRNLGWRPVVRGMAMHAVEHPHGGGEGKGVIGTAKDIWGHRIGTRTRRNKRTERLIIKTRRTRTRPFAKK